MIFATNSTEEMQIKIKMKYHYITIRMAIMKKTRSISEDMEKLKSP